ncbi:MAG TPA: flavin reductase family protein [Rhizobacter sp.]|nr:flavin reductase family protein [Rhizobacter sp.]
MKLPVTLAHACRLINHGPTVLVGSAHGGRRNVMAAAWSMPVEFVPPRVAVVIDKKTLTRDLVAASGGFTLSVPGRALLDATYTVGSVSAHEVADKFARYGIETFNSPQLGLPFVEGCVAWLECRLIPEPHAEDAYDTCFGEVISAQADARVFERGHWSFRADNTELHTLHHLGGGHFAWPGPSVQAHVLPPLKKEAP